MGSVSAAQGLMSKVPVGGAASLCHCSLADLGCASALIYFPSPISSSHCLPSSLSCAKRHRGPSSSTSPQTVRCWYTPTPQALCQPAVVTNPPLRSRAHGFPPCLHFITWNLHPSASHPRFDLVHAKCSTTKLGPSPFICLVNSLKVIELGLVR